MVRAVITGASSAIGTVCADRLRPNRHQNTTDSSPRSFGKFGLAMFRLDYLSCFLTILATVLVGRKSWTGLLISIVNSLIVCLIAFRTSQFGFIPANLVCICVYAFSIRSWLKKANIHTGSPGLSVASSATPRPPRASRHASNRPSSPPPTMATSCFAPDAARLARSFTSGKPILRC
jgi:hypothetical protein